MSRIQNVAIAVLFIISTVSAQGSKLKDSDTDINDQPAPIPPITEINHISVSTEPPKGSDTTTSPTTTTTNKTTTPTEKPSTTPVTPITTTKAPEPTTVSTTTITPTTTSSTPKPITVTTAKPTGAPPTTPVPSHRRFDGPSFIGGIVLALGLVAIGFVAFKFYKARTELNYHTL
ncbi:sialomucin core protein 24-like [Anoplophora glabripennis]|uniref:sialomucin core protein 24-like n=1 Tax=Anoplophora glabripennis TaxID=217634 RepID=UPI0008752376|nr:sialomucin core protein 24-like [Anoplophora glabripennis]